MLPIATMAFAVALPSGSQGQSRDTSLVQVLHTHLAGQYVRVSGDESAVGRVIGISGDLLHLRGRSVRLAGIEAVEVRSSQGGGTLIGATVGAAAMSAATLIVVGSHVELNALTILGSLGFGVVMGGTVGAISGRLLAPPVVQWHRCWPDARPSCWSEAGRRSENSDSENHR